MDGVFLKKKSSLIYTVISITSGVFLMLMFGYFWLFDVSVTLDDKLGYIFFTLFGIICMIIGFISFSFNFKAYFHIKDGHISARFNWNTRLECDFTEIVFVDCYYTSLIIKLNNGKQYNILSLKNADQIYTEIRKNILKSQISASAFDKNMLLSKINKIAHRRRKEWLFLIMGLVAMFSNIFICVALTGGKDLSVFNKQDWIMFGIFSAIEIVTVIIIFFVATKCGKKGTLLKEETLFLRQSVMHNTSVLPGSFLQMYIDDNCTSRVTVFGFPHEEQVYYTVEGLTAEYDLEKVFTSEIYSCMDDLLTETDIHELYEISINQ